MQYSQTVVDDGVLQNYVIEAGQGILKGPSDWHASAFVLGREAKKKVDGPAMSLYKKRTLICTK